MKKIKDRLADSISEIKELKKDLYQSEIIANVFIILFVTTVGVFLLNNYELSSELRKKNKEIFDILHIDKIKMEAQAFKERCSELKKYADVVFLSFSLDNVCYVNRVRIDKIEELDKALLHFRLGEAKK